MINFVSPLLRQARLPAPGHQLESAFLSHLSVDPDDEATLMALIREAARHAVSRGVDYIMLGLAERNAVAKSLQRRLSIHKFVSVIYLVYWEDGREDAGKIDDRIPHPEMAIL